jgi:hypothetical protein
MRPVAAIEHQPINTSTHKRINTPENSPKTPRVISDHDPLKREDPWCVSFEGFNTVGASGLDTHCSHFSKNVDKTFIKKIKWFLRFSAYLTYAHSTVLDVFPLHASYLSNQTLNYSSTRQHTNTIIKTLTYEHINTITKTHQHINTSIGQVLIC